MIVGNGYRKYGFDAYGDKVLKAEHMSNWMDDPQRVDPKGISFELGKAIEEVEDGFFLLVPTIKELFILNPDCNVIMSDETIALFKKNNVLIRGEFDGAAEVFAKKYGLRFLHSDFELGYAGDYNSAAGIDSITLCFSSDGRPYIHQNNCCPGISAGSCGGGEIDFNLPANFYKTMDVGSIANKCWASCREAIKKNGKLGEFLAKAKEKGGFYLKNSRA